MTSEVSEWEPEETAPQDGSFFWIRHSATGEELQVFWRPDMFGDYGGFQRADGAWSEPEFKVWRRA